MLLVFIRYPHAQQAPSQPTDSAAAGGGGAGSGSAASGEDACDAEARGQESMRHPRDLPCFKRAAASIAAQQTDPASNNGGALKIDISGCDLRSCYEMSRLLVALLPTELQRRAVVALDAGSNKLSGRLPISLLREMASLQILFLTGNEFAEVPPELPLLRSVTRLSLKSNRLTQVDAYRQLMPQLIHLILTDNRINSLRNFGSLTRLRKLMLAGNELSSVDDLFRPFPCEQKALDAGRALAADSGVGAGVGGANGIPLRLDNTRIINKRKFAPDCPNGEKTMAALELLRLARNKLGRGIVDSEALRQPNHLPHLRWISLAANPLSSDQIAGAAAPADSDLLRDVPDVTAKIGACDPKVIGGGASGIVFRCRGSSEGDATLVVKFFKEVSSDGGAHAEVAALKQLMKTAQEHKSGAHGSPANREAFERLILLPLGFAFFSPDRQADRGRVCAAFPNGECPSRFAAVFPLVSGHPLAKPPDIDTVTAAQFPRELYSTRQLWDPRRGGDTITVDSIHGNGLDTIRRNPVSCMTYRERFQVVRDIVWAAAAAHEAAGVIHGDIYAHNIFVNNGDGGLRGLLMDWGAGYSVYAQGGNCHRRVADEPAAGTDDAAPLRPCVPVPPGLSRFEARSLAVFAAEMIDPHRVPLCSTARPNRDAAAAAHPAAAGQVAADERRAMSKLQEFVAYCESASFMATEMRDLKLWKW